MKRILTLTVILFYHIVIADVAPNPIVAKGIYTTSFCKIQMVSEIVKADLFNDSAKVECIFNLVNLGDSVTIEIGFPEMNFHYWSMSQYSENDKKKFQIKVDDMLLTEEQIKVPKELDSIYKVYMESYYFDKEYNRKSDSIYKANNVIIKKNFTRKYESLASLNATESALDSLYKWRETKPEIDSDLWNRFNQQMQKGNCPWYIWTVHFEKNEKKVIKVNYNLPAGSSTDYKYFKYLLNTGAGWYGNIEKADIISKMHDITIKNIEEISPSNYLIDINNKTITWKFENFEPSKKDDIYIRYFNPKERKAYARYRKKRNLAYKLGFLNPVNWFR